MVPGDSGPHREHVRPARDPVGRLAVEVGHVLNQRLREREHVLHLAALLDVGELVCIEGSLELQPRLALLPDVHPRVAQRLA
jgi:hypothetical protein